MRQIYHKIQCLYAILYWVHHTALFNDIPHLRWFFKKKADFFLKEQIFFRGGDYLLYGLR